MSKLRLLELVWVQVLGLAVTLVQALGPVMLGSRKVELMRVVLRVVAWLLELVLKRVLEWVCCGQLEALLEHRPRMPQQQFLKSMRVLEQHHHGPVLVLRGWAWVHVVKCFCNLRRDLVLEQHHLPVLVHVLFPTLVLLRGLALVSTHRQQVRVRLQRWPWELQWFSYDPHDLVAVATCKELELLKAALARVLGRVVLELRSVKLAAMSRVLKLVDRPA